MSVEVAVPLPSVLRIAGEYEAAGRLDEADELLSRALQAAPRHADALHLKAIVAFRAERAAQAAALMEQAIAQGPDNPLYLRNICAIYETLGRYDEALAAGRRAVALDPSEPDSLHNLALVHYRRLELAESIGCAERAVALDPARPGPHFALAEALLLGGDLARGWEEYEWRFRLAEAPALLPPTDRPQWDGAPIGGTLLLIADQGFGDVIQFARYIPWAAARAGEVAVACSAETRPLLRQLAPGLRLFSHWEACPAFAAWCPLSGLPRLHATRLDSIPAPVPYVRADPARAAAWAGRLASLAPPGHRRVGLVWAGRPTHKNDRNRSMRLGQIGALADVAAITLVALQKGPALAQAGAWYGRAPLVNLGAEIADFEDTAAIIAGLDLVVTIDTSVAHLAGAMGRPVWVLLPFAPDWRWLLGRPDSPWYPTARLFRQAAPGDWASATGALAAALSHPGSAG